MPEDDDDLLRNPKIITCIVPVGLGKNLVDALFHERDLNTGNVTRGRGASHRSGTFADEMDILTVVVEPGPCQRDLRVPLRPGGDRYHAPPLHVPVRAQSVDPVRTPGGDRGGAGLSFGSIDLL